MTILNLLGRIDNKGNWLQVEGEKMARKPFNTIDPFNREASVTVDNKTITKGDKIKIKGVHGTEFTFVSLVTNPKTGVQWIDCVELERGVSCGMRSFYVDRVKPIVKRNNVKRRRSRKAPRPD